MYTRFPHTSPEHECDVQVKDLENSLALVYNFYSPDYNFFELAEGYGWKEYMFCVAKGLAKVKCGGI